MRFSTTTVPAVLALRVWPRAAAFALGRGGSDHLFLLDNLLFALGMARSTYVARICERPEEITPSIYTGLAINHVASISYGVLGGPDLDEHGRSASRHS